MSTYKEGILPQGAIRSVLKCTQNIIVFEGTTEKEIENSELYPPTDLGGYKRYLAHKGFWTSESEKRTAMLHYAKHKFGQNFWCLLIDADEILVWGEYLPDWLGQLKPGWGSDENVVPIKLTEGIMREDDGTLWTDIAPSHLYHSCIIERYSVGAWQIQAKNGMVAVLDRQRALRPPAMGEPHIHHRSYLRRGERFKFRANQHEEQRWLDERGLERTY